MHHKESSCFGRVDSPFTDQLYADDLVLAAESGALDSASDLVLMVFGPRMLSSWVD